MQVTFVTTLMLSLLASAGEAAAQAAGPIETRQAKLERLEWARARRSVCGVHALYVWLRAAGASRSQAEVERELGLSPVGHDMLTVAQAATRLGVEAEVRRFDSAAAFEDCQVPMIALAKRSTTRQGVVTRHYLVVLEREDGLVSYLDPTTAQRLTCDVESFCAAATGHYIATTSAVRGVLEAALGGCSAFVLVALLLRLRPGTSSVRVAATVMVSAFLAAGVGRAQTWRNDSQDGPNALTLLLKAHHVPVERGAVLAALQAEPGPTSVLSLSRAARRLGVETRVVASQPFDALKPLLPAIAHLRNPRQPNGGFVVLFGLDDVGVSFFSSGSSTFARMPWESFLRDWSGHLLVPESAAPSDDGDVLLPLLATAGLALCYVAVRLR